MSLSPIDPGDLVLTFGPPTCCRQQQMCWNSHEFQPTGNRVGGDDRLHCKGSGSCLGYGLTVDSRKCVGWENGSSSHRGTARSQKGGM